MVRILVENIMDFATPDTGDEAKVGRRESRRILKELEKKYNLESCFVCRKTEGTYELYANKIYSHISDEDKKMWIKHYKAYVKSSRKYRNIMDLLLF